MKLESKPAANMLLYVVTIAIGLLLMYLARDFRSGGTNVLCGFLLGCMLAGLGMLGVAVGESRTVELDERRKSIVLDVRRRVGSRQIIIPFSDIKGFGIGLQGKASAGTRYYDVVVRLNSGKEIHLFGGCVFEGRMSRDWAEGIRSRFEQAAVR
jgi:hypothetical protein